MIRAPQDAGAGLFLVLVAAVALWQGADLPAGSLRHIGPGMLPRSLAILTGLCGIGLTVVSYLVPGAALERWPIRQPLFILGAAVVFGLAVRPLGVAVAGPLAIAIASLASRETRWVEVLVFSAIMTAFCIVLFKFMLSLPIPLAPWLIGY